MRSSPSSAARDLTSLTPASAGAATTASITRPRTAACFLCAFIIVCFIVLFSFQSLIEFDVSICLFRFPSVFEQMPIHQLALVLRHVTTYARSVVARLPSDLRQHLEIEVAAKCAPGRGYLHRAGSRPGRYVRIKMSGQDVGETGWHAVKGHAGRAGQIVSQDIDGFPRRGGHRI